MTLYDRLERRLDPGDVPAIEIPERGDGFPREALETLLRGEVGRLVTPIEQGGALVWADLMRVCARLAEADLELTLCLGGVVLGSLPLIVAGTADQRGRFFADIRAGKLAALGLSEWDHGSDLLAGDTTATEHRVTGEKRPTNNGTEATWITVLARTGERDDPFGQTLYLLHRDTPGVHAGAPIEWPCVPAMDLSGVRLDDALGEPLGAVGDGFPNARKILETSRSGVACMATGAHAAVFQHAWTHAHDRTLYGAPIAELDAVQDLLTRSFRRLVTSVALSRHTARRVTAADPTARSWSCAAKLLCPQLLEESLHDCGTLLGTRSLLRPFADLRRDAPILAIFDGSSQLMLDEMWRTVRTWPADTTPDAPLLIQRAREARNLPQRDRFQLSWDAAWALAHHAAAESRGAPAVEPLTWDTARDWIRG